MIYQNKPYIQKQPTWRIPEHQVTDENIFHNRRKILSKMAGAGALMLAPSLASMSLASMSFAGISKAKSAEGTKKSYPSLPSDYFPARKDTNYLEAGRALTKMEDALSYCNFYEFGSHKKIASAAQKMQIDPTPTGAWKVELSGLIDHPQILDLQAIYKLLPPQERIYRFRCVEAWAMTVPWTGFPLADLLRLASPNSTAKFVEFETKMDESVMPGLKSSWYPWPYRETVTIEEAANSLAFMATGLYGAPLQPQNGAPVRLVLPWKYGFKSIKSIVAIRFTDKRRPSFWEQLQDKEYGFWANVNPEVDHRRWSQASERLLSTGNRVPTQLYNGYGEEVAHLYEPFKARLGNLLYR